MSERTLLFSVTASECEWQVFRAGGNGGQNQNKTSTGVRCIHHPSGARGEARDSRSQVLNKRSAFLRMAESATFKFWHRMEVARRTGMAAQVETDVLRAMDPVNLRVEVKGGAGRWVSE